MTVGKRVLYRGQVQGVGFRYTAQGLAAGFPVAGYARNLRSGDVELVVEGEADQVDAFLATVASRMARYIEQSTVQEEPPSGHQGFRIRY